MGIRVNIADQYEVPHFTEALLIQHAAETNQPFAAQTLVAIYRETEAQLFRTYAG